MNSLSIASSAQMVRISEFSANPMEGVASQVGITQQKLSDLGVLESHDVVVKVKASSVGWVDLLMLSGQYQHIPPLPYTPGLEYSGVVEWCGDDVKDLSLGDRVFVDGFVAGPRSPGKYQSFGGFAQYAVAPAQALRKIPEALSFDQACNLLGSYETAYHCLVKCANLQAGETVLIHGASGSTGLAAVHIAKLLGATVIATGRSEDKLAAVKAQGADHVMSCKSEDPEQPVRRFRDDVKALTGGKGVDVVYDGVGGAISLESMRCVKFGARFLVVGWAATPFVAKGNAGRGAPNANMLPTNLIMMKGLQVLGCPTVISTQHDPSIREERLEQILSWVDEGQIVPHISHSYALKDAKQALSDKWSGKVIGGAVIRP